MSAPARQTPKKRTASRQRRREELIRATIKCIAATGLSGVTLATVTREAGLSLGIVNLHFESKEKLLIATLQYLSDEYCAAWKGAYDREGLNAARRLRAMVDADFSRRLCQRSKLAVWFAFWGETRSRPTYRRICARADREYDEALVDICAELAREAGLHDLDTARIAATYSALSNGLWLDMLVTPGEMRRERARQICLDYLHGVFGQALEAA